MADDDASLMVEMTMFSELSLELQSYQTKLAEYEDGFDRVATLKASVIEMHKFYDAWLSMEEGLWDLDKEMSELHNCLKKFVDKLTADAEGSYESDTELLNLQTSIESSIKTLNSLKDRAAACKQQYNAELFIISVIESQHFPLLRKCIYGNMEENIASIPEESWDIFHDVLKIVLKIVPSYQLRYMLAAQPTSNITVVQCRKLEMGVAQTVRFAYWMQNELASFSRTACKLLNMWDNLSHPKSHAENGSPEITISQWNNLEESILLIPSYNNSCDSVIETLLSLNGNRNNKYISLLAWKAVIYELWRERNIRLHSDTHQLLNQIGATIKNRTHNDAAASNALQYWFSLQ